MTDEPRNKPGQSRPQETRKQSGGSSSDGKQPTSPTSSSTTGDPVRRGIGDRPEEESERTVPSDTDGKTGKVGFPRSGEESDASAVEGPKGPRVAAPAVSPDNLSQGPRSNSPRPAIQPIPKAP